MSFAGLRGRGICFEFRIVAEPGPFGRRLGFMVGLGRLFGDLRLWGPLSKSDLLESERRKLPRAVGGHENLRAGLSLHFQGIPRDDQLGLVGKLEPMHGDLWRRPADARPSLFGCKSFKN